ncbi:hypothetical protein DMC63_06350 [Streptomyces sp. WAC 05977]|nr:hypothetical protein DMC63_06350 [Streptomyces sp. WAC 05977]
MAAGFVVVGRGAVDVVSDGTGAGRDDVGVIFTGVVGAGFALPEATDVAGTVSPANAGPADAARHSVIDINSAAVDRDLRDMSGRLDSSGVVDRTMNQEAVGLNR